MLVDSYRIPPTRALALSACHVVRQETLAGLEPTTSTSTVAGLTTLNHQETRDAGCTWYAYQVPGIQRRNTYGCVCVLATYCTGICIFTGTKTHQKNVTM